MSHCKACQSRRRGVYNADFVDVFCEDTLLIGPMPDLCESYVYVYRDIKGKPRYVGKGTDARAESHLSACQKKIHPRENNAPFYRWLRRVMKTGNFSIEYAAKDLTQRDAYKLEGELIEEFGLDNLFNKVVTRIGPLPSQKPVISIPYLWGGRYNDATTHGEPRIFHTPKHAIKAGWGGHACNVTTAAEENRLHHGCEWAWARVLKKLTQKNKKQCAEKIAAFYIERVRDDVQRVLIDGPIDCPHTRTRWHGKNKTILA